MENKLPGLMGEYDDEQLNALVVQHARYFTVIQIRPGGFQAGGTNYERTEVPTIEQARKVASELYGVNRKPCLIYAVADFAGARGFSRPVENYPNKVYKTAGDRAKEAKLAKQAAKQAAKGAAKGL